MNESGAEPNPREGRCTVLLISLVAFFVLYPLLGNTHGGAILLDLFLSTALVLAVRVLRAENQSTFLVALACSIAAIVVAAASHLFHLSQFLPIGHVLALFFYLLTGSALLKSVLDPGPVTSSRLQAATCGYLLIGLGWALVYSTLEHLHAGAFHDPTGASPASHTVLAGFPHLIYYSFTTLTTLGHGDVVPVTPLARSLSTLEAITGQLYLALLVARLVGLSIVGSRDPQPAH